MYRNEAYDIFNNPNVKDLSVPIMINNCGHYIMKSTPIAKTHVPKGLNDYQLLYIASGKGHFYFDGIETVVEKGNMILYRPEEPQIYDYYSADKTEVFWIHFTGFEVEEYLKRYQIPEDKHVFHVGSSADYPWIFNQIILEIQQKRVNYPELVNMLFSHILILINRYIKEGDKTDFEMINQMERASHYFNENFNNNICINEYAKRLHISTNWFIKCFKDTMNVTPIQYILSLRISAAKRYLESTDKTISQIAACVGYDNPMYFSRLFKKVTGITPSQYRESKTN